MLSRGRPGSRKTTKLFVQFAENTLVNVGEVNGVFARMIYAESDDEMLANSNIERHKVIAYSISQFRRLIGVLSLPSLLAIVDSAIAAKDARSPPSSNDIFNHFPEGRVSMRTTYNESNAIAKVNDKNIAVISQLFVKFTRCKTVDNVI